MVNQNNITIQEENKKIDYQENDYSDNENQSENDNQSTYSDSSDESDETKSSISDYDENDEIVEDEEILNEYRNLDNKVFGTVNKKFMDLKSNEIIESNKNQRNIIERNNTLNKEDESEEDESESEKEEDESSEESDNEEEEDKDEVMVKTRNYINLPKEFERIQYRMSIYQNTLVEKMETMMNKIINIEDRLTKLEHNSKINFTEIDGEIVTIKELKLERLDIDEDVVLKALVYKNYQSIIYIMRHYYRTTRGNKVFYPIRVKSKRNFEYYLNNQWLSDSYGHYITKVICNNIQNLFLRYNDFSNKKIKEEDLYLNQQFILKLSEDKYKKEIFKHIVDELMTSSSMFVPTNPLSSF